MMNWIIQQLQHLLRSLSRLLTTPLFYIGENSLSLSSIIKLILLAFAVFIISRAISEWIKRWLLVRMGLDRGSQEAIGAVISYLLISLGFFIVLQSMGLNLSSLAVIAGVLGIGFGFGLQNLASNFISGVTLLVEQPIRVGDFVEVDDLLGTVERISIRSTIVRTLDGVFVIVPNNLFVENNIINWSYKDPKCRIHIPVGVAYNTDPILVTETLLSVARMEPGVLSYPSPKVWLRKFGDSSLDFELLAWIDQPQDSEPIKSSLNFRIEHEFSQRGIVIPFPQREIRLKNPQELSKLSLMDTPISEANKSKNSSQNGTGSELKLSGADAKKSVAKPPNNLTLRDLLRRVIYFEKCTDLELRQLIEYGYRQLFPAGQIIFQENEPGDSFYIILSGEVEVLSQRLEKYIATLHQGEFFGEMSLLLGVPRSATVQTVADSILFVVDQHDLQKLLVSQPYLADQIAQKLSERRQALRDLGLIENDLMGQTPFLRIRNRIQTLFGI